MIRVIVKNDAGTSQTKIAQPQEILGSVVESLGFPAAGEWYINGFQFGEEVTTKAVGELTADGSDLYVMIVKRKYNA
jgi:hypothetical protein